MSRKIIGLLQARTDSKRLPNKVLKNILEKPMIIHQMQRTLKSQLLDTLILVTSDEKSDDTLARCIVENNFNIFRGDKNNVLKRFYDSVEKLKLDDNDIIVRLTGDCPLHDSVIIDEAIEEFLNIDCDYLSNSVEPIYPDGLDVEVFNYKSLKLAYENAKLNSQREHVTPYIRTNKELKCVSLKKAPLHTEWRLTVDEEKDFTLITKIYEHFGDTYFSLRETVSFLESNLELLTLNSNILRNEGYMKSIEEDKHDK